MKYALLAILIIFSLSSEAKSKAQVYLYVFFHDDNSNGERFRTKVESMEQYLKVIEKSKLPMPTKPSGDYEVMGAMWCGGDIERQYNATWWDDKTKSAG